MILNALNSALRHYELGQKTLQLGQSRLFPTFATPFTREPLQSLGNPLTNLPFFIPS